MFKKQSPDEVVAYFIIDLINRDIKSARQYCTEKFATRELGAIDMATAPMTWVPEDKRPDTDQIIKHLRCSIDEDSARVWYEEQDILLLVLVKEKGHWKIDRFGTNFNFEDLLKIIGLVASVAEVMKY